MVSARARILFGFVGLLAAACAHADGSGFEDPTAPDSGRGDAGLLPSVDSSMNAQPQEAPDSAIAEAGASDASDARSEAAATVDASRDAGPDSAGPDAAIAVDAGALDPGLSLPDPAGVACSLPGTEIGCPALQVCRIATKDGGRCETCVNCGNWHAACAASNECDILFECYKGRCTNFCHVGSYECGVIANCVDVGNSVMGVCL